MSIYSASYNFPQGFLWGIVTPDSFYSEKTNNVTLFSLKEKGIKAIFLTLKWADFEPLKNNYEESLIDDVRTLLSRTRRQNIEPLIMLDMAAVPQWQNLEHEPHKDFFSAEKFNFATHIANALLPYSNYFGMYISENALFPGKGFSSDLEIHNSVRNYILSISESAKVGTILAPQSFQKKGAGLRGLFQSWSANPLKNSEMDFFGISADEISFEGIQNIMKETRKPLFIFKEDIAKIPPAVRADALADKIYDSWHFYQKGWPLLGFFAALDPNEDSRAMVLFTETSNKNAFEISTENENLPEKWIRLLKD